MQIGRRPSQSYSDVDFPLLSELSEKGTRTRVLLALDGVLAGAGGVVSILWADDILGSVISPRVFVGPLGALFRGAARGRRQVTAGRGL